MPDVPKVKITPQKWQRTGKPKSRNGCLTCRRRKVKCDEQRPICLRCIKTKLECEGYIQPPGSTKSGQLGRPNARLILPKALPPVAPPSLGLSKPLLDTEVENRYLSHFQNKTISGSGNEGILDWSIWNRLVLQYCHQHPFVRDSVVAIGALVKSFETADPSRAVPATENDGPLAKMHMEFALLKYGRAVQRMRAALGSSSLQDRLLGCLLVFCFETLLNNRHAAIAHIVSGYGLLQDSLVESKPGEEACYGWLCTMRSEVDEELVDAFEHLDMQISTVYDPRPPKIHEAILDFSTTRWMPSHFRDLTEARKYMTIVQRRCHHFLAISWTTTESMTLYRDLVDPPFNVTVMTGCNVYSTPYKVPDGMRIQQAVYADEITQWYKAFDHLFQKTCFPGAKQSRDYVVATLLRIHAITTKIFVASTTITEEVLYDAFMPEFRLLLILVQRIVAVQKEPNKQSAGMRGFRIDLGIVAPLFLLLIRCRNGAMRREALRILRSWHPEAIWHPLLIAEIGNFMMETEEVGLDGGFIPESARAVITAVCEGGGVNGKKQVLLQCCQRRGGPNGELTWHEKYVFYT